MCAFFFKLKGHKTTKKDECKVIYFFMNQEVSQYKMDT